MIFFQGIPSPWATAAPAGGNNVSNLLGSLMNNAGSGNMANLATSLVAQALQNKPGGMLIGGNHFGGQGSAPMGGQFNNSGPRGGGGYMDRSGGRDDYRVSIFFKFYCLNVETVCSKYHNSFFQFFFQVLEYECIN